MDDCLTHLWVEAYLWVEAMVVYKQITHKEGVQRLAATLRLPPTTIFWWHNFGTFFKKLRLDPNKAKRGAVSRAYNKWKLLSKADQKAIHSILARGGSAYDVTVRMRKSLVFRKNQADRRAKIMKKRGQLNESAVNMVLVAALALAQRFYQDQEIACEIVDDNDEILLKVT